MDIRTPTPALRKRKSPTVTPEMAAKMKALLAEGMCQHDIAALFGVNQGRVSEVNTGQLHAGVEPAQLAMVFA